jgi:hypothetical protein
MLDFDPSPHGATTVRDKRGPDVRYLTRIRKSLIAGCSGKPTPTEWLLIDRAAAISQRLRLLDCDSPEEPARGYIELTIRLGQILAQLGVQPAPQASPIVPVPQTCEAMA